MSNVVPEYINVFSVDPKHYVEGRDTMELNPYLVSFFQRDAKHRKPEEDPERWGVYATNTATELQF